MLINISMSAKGTSKTCSRSFTTKALILMVVLLIGVQYLVNIMIYQRNRSDFFGMIDEWHNRSRTYLQQIVNADVRTETTTANTTLELCPLIPPDLKGRVTVNTQIPAWAYIEEQNAMLEFGGRYKPAGCKARNRVAIVIPYRDREIHLKIFLQNIHPFLQRQQIEYGIYVVEMAAEVKFNRALLMNVGFAEALKYYDYQCFVFHDVDLLPEDDRNLYTCPHMPRHMSTSIDKLGYRLPYAQIFGGVSAMTREHFEKINGFSNIYFGWGGEDDDMYRRILYSDLVVIRYSTQVARYKMMVHKKENGNPERYSLLRTVKARQKTDGLNSLKYDVLKTEFKRLYTWILISVNMTDILENEPIHRKKIKLPVKGAKSKVAVRKISQLKEQAVAAENKNGIIVIRRKTLPKITDVAPKRKNPVIVSWIPSDFKGVLPTNLTKFDIPKSKTVQNPIKGVKKKPQAAKQPAKARPAALRKRYSPPKKQKRHGNQRQRGAVRKGNRN